MQVTFVGEGAIDHGGPRREFFRLLAKEASEHYFHGAPGCKFFTNNVIALQVSYQNIILKINNNLCTICSL